MKPGFCKYFFQIFSKMDKRVFFIGSLSLLTEIETCYLGCLDQDAEYA